MIKILVSHFQVVSLAAKFQLDWGPVMDYLFELMGKLSSISEDIPAVDCEITEYESFEGIPLVYAKVMLFGIAPFIFIPLLWIVLKIYERIAHKEHKVTNMIFVVTTLVFIYLTQSSLAKQG